MPAKPGRPVISIAWDYDVEDVKATIHAPDRYERCKTDDSGRRFYVQDLPRLSKVELRSISSKLGLPSQPTVTNDQYIAQIREYCRSSEHGSLIAIGSGTDPNEERAPKVPAPKYTPPTPYEAPLPRDTPQVPNRVGDTEYVPFVPPEDKKRPEVDSEMVGDLIRRIAGELDTDVVDQLTKRINDLKPHVTRVELPHREPKEVPGRQHAVFGDVLRLIGARLNVYLVGPPGTGKSTIAEKCAHALDLEFGAISLGPTTPASRIWGYQDATGNYVSTSFRQCYENGGVFLLDEMDNGHAGILAEMNMALANGGAAFPDGFVPRNQDFVLVACANTYGTGATAQFIGRNALDAATLDRFTMVHVPVDEGLERHLAEAESSEHGRAWHETIKRFRKNADKAGLKVVISPRSTIEGARMLEAGFSQEQVISMRVLRGLPEDVLAKVRG